MNLKVKMGKKFTDKLREKSHVIIDNMVLWCCCLWALLLMKSKRHRNYKKESEGISLSEKLLLLLLFFYPFVCVLQGRIFKPNKAKLFSWLLETIILWAWQSFVNIEVCFVFTLLPALKPSSNHKIFPECYKKTESQTYLSLITWIYVSRNVIIFFCADKNVSQPLPVHSQISYFQCWVFWDLRISAAA